MEFYDRRSALLSKFEAFYLQRRRFIIRAVVLSAAAWVVASSLAASFGSEHRIGVDLNEIRCLPWRVYYITFGHDPVRKGQYIAFYSLHGLMGPRFEGKLIGKQVAAVAGDHVVVSNDVLAINGTVIGPLNLIKRLRVEPGHFDRDVVVPQGKLLVLGSESRSYDGRYWGWLGTSEVIGTVEPVL